MYNSLKLDDLISFISQLDGISDKSKLAIAVKKNFLLYKIEKFSIVKILQFVLANQKPNE